ncbi:Anthranilate synthase component 2 [Desulfosarcina cetonica]|uniref:anthranilate synthase component II n=1 Tax=Desulfosarcina cetonica TaxID=90730 RepID=UPI0009F97B20|nr:aminodeoxychorismate/anthranilate synthase component II [Desulfosarcina cetonica]VTR69014.1 Anthranilate synthase component 2 [Desulfosarcina cetonica]
MATLLVIDNYDSFTYNLVQMFMHYDLGIDVVRSDQITLEAVAALRPDYLLVSPGPKDPAHAGISKALIARFYRSIPIFGVCLGMQCINEVFEGQTRRAAAPMHGKTSRVFHQQAGLFGGIPSPFRVARYHSLAVWPTAQALADDLVVTGRTLDGTVMGLSHQRYPLHGVQFHPESFLTEHGFTLVENFLRLGPLQGCLPANGPRPNPCAYQLLESGATFEMPGGC